MGNLSMSEERAEVGVSALKEPLVDGVEEAEAGAC